jgi:hypothetical protein
MIGDAGGGGESRFEVLEDGLLLALPADAVDQFQKTANDTAFDGPWTVEPPFTVEPSMGGQPFPSGASLSSSSTNPSAIINATA